MSFHSQPTIVDYHGAEYQFEPEERYDFPVSPTWGDYYAAPLSPVLVPACSRNTAANDDKITLLMARIAEASAPPMRPPTASVKAIPASPRQPIRPPNPKAEPQSSLGLKHA